jgi:hypothetical protein
VIIASTNADITSATGPDSHTAHIGSTACSINDASYAAVVACGYSNATSNSVRVKYMIANTSTMASDVRMKKDIERYQPKDDLLERVLLSKIYKFNYMKQKDNDPIQLGFIAQEMLNIFPEMVNTKNYHLKKVVKNSTNGEYYYKRGRNNVRVDKDDLVENDSGELYHTVVKDKYPITMDSNTIHSVMWQTVRSLGQLYDEIKAETMEIDNLLALHGIA